MRLHERAVHGTDVNVPYTRLLARGVEHVQGRVLGVDAERNSLELETQQLHYDALVLTLGSELRSRIPSRSALSYALCDEAHALQLSAALPGIPDGARVLASRWCLPGTHRWVCRVAGYRRIGTVSKWAPASLLCQ